MCVCIYSLKLSRPSLKIVGCGSSFWRAHTSRNHLFGFVFQWPTLSVHGGELGLVILTHWGTPTLLFGRKHGSFGLSIRVPHKHPSKLSLWMRKSSMRVVHFWTSFIRVLLKRIKSGFFLFSQQTSDSTIPEVDRTRISTFHQNSDLKLASSEAQIVAFKCQQPTAELGAFSCIAIPSRNIKIVTTTHLYNYYDYHHCYCLSLSW